MKLKNVLGLGFIMSIAMSTTVLAENESVITNDTTVYTLPNSSSEEIDSLDLGTEVNLLAQSDSGYNIWYKVELEQGTGYVLSQDVDSTLLTNDLEIEDAQALAAALEAEKQAELEAKQQAELVASKKAQKAAQQTSKADQIINYGKKFMGTPYRSGGTSLSSGVDCSGFTSSVFADNGISISRTSRGQATNGVHVSKSNLQPGDLVMFDTSGVNNGGISHVAIYIGNGQILHSSSSKGISIASMTSGYWAGKYVTARRVI